MDLRHRDLHREGQSEIIGNLSNYPIAIFLGAGEENDPTEISYSLVPSTKELCDGSAKPDLDKAIGMFP